MVRLQRGPQTLGIEPQVLNVHRNGESVNKLANRLNMKSTMIQSILDWHLNLKSANAWPRTRNYVSLRHRIPVLYLLDAGNRPLDLCRQFGTSYRTIGRIKKSLAKIMEMDRNRVSLDVRRNLYGTYPSSSRESWNSFLSPASSDCPLHQKFSRHVDWQLPLNWELKDFTHPMVG